MTFGVVQVSDFRSWTPPPSLKERYVMDPVISAENRKTYLAVGTDENGFFTNDNSVHHGQIATRSHTKNQPSVIGNSTLVAPPNVTKASPMQLKENRLESLSSVSDHAL